MLRNSFLIGCLISDMRKAEKQIAKLGVEIKQLNVRLNELDKKTATDRTDSPTESAQHTDK